MLASMTRAWILAAIAGCTFTGPPPAASNDGGLDAPPIEVPDAPPDMADPNCFGGYMPICLETPPTEPRTVTAAIDTSPANPLCAPTTNDVPACVVTGTSITVGLTIRAFGDRPLVLLATSGSIVVTGTVDVSTRRDTTRGAGSNMPGCNPGVNPTGDGGGWGGSFATVGGDGGDGNGGGAGTKGMVLDMADGTLRGGCDGRTGSGMTPGGGGRAGGAVLLSSPTLITISGSVLAAGSAGGGGVGFEDGGGGGGSGGAIVLDAPSFMITGTVFAHGGGGGEGSGQTNGFSGVEAIPPTPSLGGSGNPDGGDGGDGSSGNNTGDDGDDGTDGGGGGGGGAGYIRATSRISGGNISPDPQQP
jgi:hypothetical protein